MMQRNKISICVVLFLLGAANAFSQDELAQRGSIPQELLRPRRDEAPRYPIDTVIGPLGQGRASEEAYETARKTAAALLAGDMSASILSSVNRALLESWMSILNTINPRYFRLGGGQEEPDGSFSFLIRFAGREQGITGELFIRFEERRRAPPPPPPPAQETEAASEEKEIEAEAAAVVEAAAGAEAETADVAIAEAEPPPAAAAPVARVQVPANDSPPIKVWILDELVLEEARSRDAENAESRHRFDFPPYERFF
ncbi:MAG: hypothetical protein LBI06_08660 [Treponema sp.]|jgi:hypothetical protein|nr:hypothetical protein [Treponema sp.]